MRSSTGATRRSASSGVMNTLTGEFLYNGGLKPKAFDSSRSIYRPMSLTTFLINVRDLRISTSLSKLLVIESMPRSCIAAKPLAALAPFFSSSLISTDAVTLYTGVWERRKTYIPMQQASTLATNQGQYTIYLKNTA